MEQSCQTSVVPQVAIFHLDKAMGGHIDSQGGGDLTEQVPLSYDVVQHWQDLRNHFRRDEDDVRGGSNAKVFWKTMIFLQYSFSLVWEALNSFVLNLTLFASSIPHHIQSQPAGPGFRTQEKLAFMFCRY